MKLKNVVFLTSLVAGSLQASIITAYTGTTPQGSSSLNPAYVDGGITSPDWTQNFSTSSVSLPGLEGALNTGQSGGYTGFQHIVLETATSTELTYDPNGSAQAGCSVGKLNTASGSLTGFPANCVGNYALANPSTGTQTTLPASTITSFSILLDEPEDYVAFELSIPGVLTHDNTNVQVYTAGGQLIDQAYVEITTIGGDSWVYVSEAQNFTEVTLSSTGWNEANSVGWNFVLGDVEAAPEPGTMALLGLGLAGIGYFARRRKAA